MKKIKIVIISGAGVSKESGLATFRDHKDGLWENYKVEDVATVNALNKNTETFLKFYNERKNQLKTVEPNKAHIIIAELEKKYTVTVATQNVDNLHERAGSTNVLHLHGELTKMKSSGDDSYVVDYINDIKVGDKCPSGYQLRPDVTLFGEGLPAYPFHSAINSIVEADVIIVVGTSLQVNPVAQLPWEGKETAIIYYVDPAELKINVPKQKRPFFYHIKEIASVGMKKISDELDEMV